MYEYGTSEQGIRRTCVVGANLGREMDYTQIFISVLSSLMVAVITAFVTVKLSLRRFYTERWWEKKAEVYSKIIEALHRYKIYDEKKLKIEMEYPRKDNDELEKSLSVQWAESNAEIEKAADLGAFIVSKEVESILTDFLNRKIGDPDYEPLFEIIEADLKKVKKCLSEVKSAAKKDLGIK